MQIDIATGLIAMLQPFWLAAIPFALLPIVNELLKPGQSRPTQAGWGRKAHGSRWIRFRQNRLIRPALLGLGALLLVIGLSGPTRPTLKFMESRLSGHRWAVVLDSSGSMSIVDPGTMESRLKRLASALEMAIRDRPNDEFTIVRVAGYADRIGPATADHRFLSDILQQIRPALPGEDGTSLGEGLILAAESLSFKEISRSNQSILVISDGRENRPDSNAKSLTEVAPLLLKLKIQVDWLRVAIPETSQESIESKTLGELSRITLENLVHNSGGSILNLNSGDDWPALTASTIGRLKRPSQFPDQFSPIAIVSLIAAYCIWTILIIHGLFPVNFPRHNSNRFILLLLVTSTIFLGIGLFQIWNRQSIPQKQRNGIESARTLILMDTSPSMAAIDTQHGSRLASSKRVINGLIQRFSLTTDRKAGLIAFSGRAVGLSPWTTDWTALDQITQNIQVNQIAPSGSNWNSAFNSALELYFSPDSNLTEVDRDIILITDGEASDLVSNEVLKTLKERKIRVHVITVGTDRPPGMTFSVGPDFNKLWIDQRSKAPARSMRHDQFGRELSDSTGGKFLAIGTKAFDASQIAEQYFNKPPSPALEIKPTKSSSPRRSMIIAFAIFQACELFKLLQNLSNKQPRQLASIFLVIFMISCSPTDRKSEIETILEAASTHLRNGNIVTAEAMLNQIRLKYSEEPVIFYDLALLAITCQNPEDAIKHLNQASSLLIQNHPSENFDYHQLNTRILAALGFAQIQSGLWDESVKSLEKAIEIDRIHQTISETERTRIQLNLKFAYNNRSGSNSDKPNKTQSESGQFRQPDNSGLIKLESPLQELRELAEASRLRARTSRSRFQQAGDEISKPADRLKTDRWMDW